MSTALVAIGVIGVCVGLLGMFVDNLRRDVKYLMTRDSRWYSEWQQLNALIAREERTRRECNSEARSLVYELADKIGYTYRTSPATIAFVKKGKA